MIVRFACLALLTALVVPKQALATPNNASDGDKLIFVFSDNCAACQQFIADIGKYYDKTQEARRLPMARISLAEWQAKTHPFAHCDTAPVEVTPTFIQLIDCREQDRITGYSRDELWWLGHRRMLNRLRAR